MLTLYSMPSSGNSYKVRLLLAKLGVPYKHVATESGSSEAFRKMNPNGKVPLVQFEDGRTLAESNAILLHFAEGTRFVPEDKYARAKMYEWMFWEQYSHEPVIAVRGAIMSYEKYKHRRTPEILAEYLENGHRVLGIMETQLQKTPYMAGDAFSTADIALYGYTHSAGTKGGFEMERFPAINAWLARCAGDAGHVPLEWGTED
ncbi:MAG: glutathione S-transferase family protein, partial [Rhizobiaceae bacterium]